jgi:thymidylate synthase
MTTYENQYLDLLRHVLENGKYSTNRTGINTYRSFCHQMRFDISDGTIPLLTTKKMHWKSIIHEIIWYMAGDTNVKYLQDNGVRIWNEWADENGDLGPVYGEQFRRVSRYKITPNPSPQDKVIAITPEKKYVVHELVDQVANVQKQIVEDPTSRRLLVNLYNVADLPEMRLPPCHFCHQYFCTGENYETLNLVLYQRSADLFLGVPFNIAQYSIMLRMMCKLTGKKPGVFVWNGTDCHIYENHIEQVKEQITRTPYQPPKLEFADKQYNDMSDFKFDDFILIGYNSHPKLAAPVAV